MLQNVNRVHTLMKLTPGHGLPIQQRTSGEVSAGTSARRAPPVGHAAGLRVGTVLEGDPRRSNTHIILVITPSTLARARAIFIKIILTIVIIIITI